MLLNVKVLHVDRCSGGLLGIYYETANISLSEIQKPGRSGACEAKKQLMLALIMLVSIILWGSFMMGWFEGVEIYLLPLLIVLWLFFILQWTKR